MVFEKEIAEAIKGFSAEELTDLRAFVRALKSGAVNAVKEWLILKGYKEDVI